MDTEQQVRLNFLEEVGGYFNQIESVVLGLTAPEFDFQQLDAAMRAAHSVKGGAAMMGFPHLSQVAHRMEDFLKILRVRQDSAQVNTEIETLLLEGVDAMHTIGRLYHQGREIGDRWLVDQVHPIFQQLQDHLGELRQEDEDALLAQEEQVDVSTILFTSGVEDCLDYFEEQLSELNPQQLQEEIAATAEQLAEFGRMSQLGAFVSLCDSVQAVVSTVPLHQIQALGQEVLAVWRRSHSLVLIGLTAQLPTVLTLPEAFTSHQSNHLPTYDLTDLIPTLPIHVSSAIGQGTSQIGVTASDHLALEAPDLDSIADLDLAEVEDLPDLQDMMANLDLSQFESISDRESDREAEDWVTDPPATRDPVGVDAEISCDHPVDWNDPVSFDDRGSIVQEPAFSESTNSLNPTQGTDSGLVEHSQPQQQTQQLEVNSQPLPPVQTGLLPESSGSTVRVPVQQLYKINALFGELIVERNAVNLRLSQLQNLVALMQRRMQQLDQSNTQLRQWYDRASLEGLVSAQDPQPETVARGMNMAAFQPHISLTATDHFDALEMDRYTDLHLVSQDQIETIVQLQEVTADIELNLREMGQATSDLNYTTQALQRNITQTQMRPFADMVSRFPRTIRDLSVEYGKQVELKLEGEATLIDRATLEALTDPLNHLLRNSFDHGIESTEARVAMGKPGKGTITLRAMHRGNQTIITLQDDGQGINLEKIRNRLRQWGITEPEIRQLADRDLLETIFEPGFTTADQVTELSGRGMGMDVVRTNLQQIRGDIRIDTQPNQGTRFTIRVPLSLSILRVMVVEMGRMIYAIPVDSVASVVRLRSEDIKTVGSREILTWNNTSIELVRPEQWLSFRGPNTPFEMDGTPTISKPVALVIHQGDRSWGLCIDQFWGEQEISLRAVNSPIPLPPGFSGSTILGDGRVIPLIDPFSFLEWVIDTQTAAQLEAIVGERARFAPTPPTPAAIKPKPSPEPEPDLLPILVVDDSVNVRRYLAVTLEKQGYRVEQAKDGQEAVDKLVNGLAVQAVICDIEMPRLDGYGVLGEVKSRSEFKDLPIVMLTSRSNEKHKKLAMNLGASAYFSKPYNDQELLKTLQRLTAKPELVGSR